jgi:hypothetical protein
MSALRLAGTVAAILSVVPLAAAASDQDDALKLAQRAASFDGYSQVAARLHALPAALPSSIPLPSATLLGSIAPVDAPRPRPAGRSATTVTYASRPLSLYYETPNRDATLAAYKTALTTAGWKRLDLAQRMPIPQGGFVQELPQFDAWCSPGDGATAITIGAPRFDATALNLNVTVSSAGSQHGSLCATGADGVAGAIFEQFRKASPLPPFSATSGVAIDYSGPASDGSTSGARITSSLGIAAVFESFAKQLRDAGWVPQGDRGSGAVRAQTFAKTVDGTPYIALLAIYPVDATHFLALADVSNNTTQ